MAGMESVELRVGEAAEVTGQTTRALRYYDKLGLAAPSKRSVGGHRIYTRDDLRRLCVVVLLRKAGMPTAEIRSALDDPDICAVINRQLERLEDRMTELGTLRGRLRSIIDDPAIDPVRLLARATAETNQPYRATKAVALLPYPDVIAARDWLVEVFGFEPGPSSGQDSDYASVVTAQGVIHLHPSYDGLQPPAEHRPPTAMIVITVADIDGLADRVRKHAAPITYGPVQQPYGVLELVVADLVGHPWCFHQPLPERS